MKEKFNNNFEDKEEKYTKEEYEKAFYDSIVESSMILFEKIRAINEIFSDFLQKDYDEFLNLLNEYFKNHKTVEGSLNYVRQKNPKNLWVELVRLVSEYNPEDEINDNNNDMPQEIIDKIKANRKGKNIN